MGWTDEFMLFQMHLFVVDVLQFQNRAVCDIITKNRENIKKMKIKKKRKSSYSFHSNSHEKGIYQFLNVTINKLISQSFRSNLGWHLIEEKYSSKFKTY